MFAIMLEIAKTKKTWKVLKISESVYIAYCIVVLESCSKLALHTEVKIEEFQMPFPVICLVAFSITECAHYAGAIHSKHVHIERE